MTTIYHQLPDKIIALNPTRREWKFEISRGVALLPSTQTIIVDDEPVEEEVFAPRAYSSKLADLKLDYFKLPIEAGMTIVTAPTGVGKTQMALNMGAALAEHLSVGWITLNEPAKYSDFLNTAKDVEDLLHEQAVLPDVLIIDSFRLLQFSVSGTTRSGGVSSGLFEMLTELNNAAESVGVMIVGLFNPMSADANQQALFNQELASSVHQIVELATVETGNFRSRSGDRKPTPFSVNGAKVSAAPVGAVIRAEPTDSPFNISQKIFG